MSSNTTTTTSKKQKSGHVKPDHVGVVLVGSQANNNLAMETAKALTNKGMQIVLGVGIPKSTTTQMECIDPQDSNFKTKLNEAVKSARDKGKVVIGVDVSGNPNVELFREMGIPYVLNRREEPSTTQQNQQQQPQQNQQQQNQQQQTQQNQQQQPQPQQNQQQQPQPQQSQQPGQRNDLLAVIDEDFNMFARFHQQMWQDASRRFPGLLGGWQLQGWESMPRSFMDFDHNTDMMLESFNRLFDETWPDSTIKKLRDQSSSESQGVPKNYLEGHSHSEYSAKNASGSSSFTFRQQYNGDQPAAEGIADSVLFLAQKHQQGAKPRVFSLVDVMESPMLRLGYF
jgi:hypothetical protein